MVQFTRLVIAGFVIWFVFLIYTTTLLYRSGGAANEYGSNPADEAKLESASNDISSRLDQALKDLKKLQDHNSALSRLIQKKEKSKNNIKKMTQCNHDGNDNKLTYESENARRFLENGINEFWYATKSQMEKIKGATNVQLSAENSLKLLRQQYSAFYADSLQLANVENQNLERQRKLKLLEDLVKNKLERLQNPDDCKSARKLLCDLNKGCGFGCQLHHVVFCLITAFSFNRTLILDSNGWSYSQKGWTGIFHSVGEKCTQSDIGKSVQYSTPEEASGPIDTIKLPIIDSIISKPEQTPLSIPKALETALGTLHGLPSVWWIGQFVGRLWRLQPEIDQILKEKVKNYQFELPVVGVHVRRTDKVGSEAAFHSLAEYMDHVDLWFDIQDAKSAKYGSGMPLKRRIYLATDDASVIREAKKSYPHYDVLADTSHADTAALRSRYTDSSLRGLIADVHFLAHCQYFVCTFSSQVCRLAFELAQTMDRMDPSQMHMFTSLDDVFYFGGQLAHQQIAIMDHKSNDSSEIDFLKNDIVGLAGNHWDGYSKGHNERTGLFPSYKVKEKLRTTDFLLLSSSDIGL